MIGIFFAVSFVIYGALSWMIVYHLQRYTIDKALSRRAIVVFITVTIVLVIVQTALFFGAKDVTLNPSDNVRTGSFGTF